MSEIDSLGNELSAYIQRDFECFSINAQASTGFWGGFMSMRLDTNISELTRSLGISIAYSF